jgi:predicted site-specific integrase-resolvase
VSDDYQAEYQPLEQLLTTAEAAGLVGVNPHTMAKWARTGLIDFVLTPTGQRRYRETTIRDIISGKTKPKEKDVT